MSCLRLLLCGKGQLCPFDRFVYSAQKAMGVFFFYNNGSLVMPWQVSSLNILLIWKNICEVIIYPNRLFSSQLQVNDVDSVSFHFAVSSSWLTAVVVLSIPLFQGPPLRFFTLKYHNHLAINYIHSYFPLTILLFFFQIKYSNYIHKEVKMLPNKRMFGFSL